MDTNVEELIERADRLMIAGHVTQAQELVMRTIELDPQNKGTYADAVGIFLNGGLFTEAQSLFEKYTLITGNNLDSGGGSDFSLKDIQEMAAKAAASKATPDGGVRFKKIPGIWSLITGISAFTMYADRIEIQTRSGLLRYPWNEVSAETKLKDSGRYWMNDITLQVPNKRIKFKTVPSLSTYFQNEGELLPELRKHINVTDVK